MITFENVAYSYGGGELLSDVSLKLAPGVVPLPDRPLGRWKVHLSQAGLCRIAPHLGPRDPVDNDVTKLSRDDVARTRRRIGIVHQDCKFLDHMTLAANMALPFTVSDRESDRQDMDDLLGWVGLKHLADALPPQLSGGERQRAALARAVIVDPDVILADEPTGNVDWEMSLRILTLLVELNRMGKTILVATHDLNLIRQAKAQIQARVLRIATAPRATCGGRPVKFPKAKPASPATRALEVVPTLRPNRLADDLHRRRDDLPLRLRPRPVARLRRASPHRWSEALAKTATIRLSAPAEQVQIQTDAILAALATTPGIASLSPDRRCRDDESCSNPGSARACRFEALPIPRLIEVVEADPPYDAEGLKQRLTAEAPGAILDDHTRWRRPLAEAASRIRLLGVLSIAIVLIGATMAAMITLAARAALATNAEVIRVLRLVGAKDSYIARAFVRRFTLRTFAGAAVGAAAGLIGVAALPAADAAGGFLTRPRLSQV